MQDPALATRAAFTRPLLVILFNLKTLDRFPKPQISTVFSVMRGMAWGRHR